MQRAGKQRSGETMGTGRFGGTSRYGQDNGRQGFLPSSGGNMARLTLLTLLALGAALSLPFAGAKAQEAAGTAPYKVVVNAANTTASESKATLSKLFLKKIREWGDKTKVTAYDLDEKSEARKAFSDDVHQKSVSAIKSYWQRMIFSGRDVPPDEISSEADLLRKVAADKGAIGYVSAKTPLPEGVKELKVKDE